MVEATVESAAASRRSVVRRAQLLDAADRAIADDGPDVSMAAIAAAAGVTKPILYRHFGDKGGLYRALAEHHTDDLLHRIRAALTSHGGLRKRAEGAVDAYLGALEEQPHVYRFLVHRASEEEPSVAGQVAHFQQRLAAELAAGIAVELRLPAPTAHETAWANAIVGMVRAAGEWWLDVRPMPRAQLVMALVDLLYGGLATQAARAQAGPVTP